MEAAKAEEAFLQAREEGETEDRGRLATDTDPTVEAPMGMTVTVVVTVTTTRNGWDDNPGHRAATHPLTRR